jgi:hypothetical protein
MSPVRRARPGLKVRKPPQPRKVTLTLSIREAVYLDHLVRFGVHGVSRQEVLQFFLRKGLQDAMASRFFDR